MNYIIVYPDELNHFGVKGMKWGVRKEPYSNSQIMRRQKDSSMSQERKAKIKKAAKIGAAVAVTAAVAYGGYKLHAVRQSNKAAVGKYIMENGYFGKTKITGKELQAGTFIGPKGKGQTKALVTTYNTRKNTLSKGILGPNIKVEEFSKSFTNKPVYLGRNKPAGLNVASSSRSRDIGRRDPVNNKFLNKDQIKYYSDYYNRYIKK